MYISETLNSSGSFSPIYCVLTLDHDTQYGSKNVDGTGLPGA